MALAVLAALADLVLTTAAMAATATVAVKEALEELAVLEQTDKPCSCLNQALWWRCRLPGGHTPNNTLRFLELDAPTV